MKKAQMQVGRGLAKQYYLGGDSISMMVTTSKICVEDWFQRIPLQAHESARMFVRSGRGKEPALSRQGLRPANTTLLLHK